MTIMDRGGHLIQIMLVFAEPLPSKGARLPVLNPGGGTWTPPPPMGPMVFTVMAALAQMELEIKRERITDAMTERRPPARTSAAAVRPSPTPGSAMPSG
jgi:DNA invertase Pin-like site-specific DNA recombinase